MAYQTIYEYSGTIYGRTTIIRIEEDSASTLTKDDIEVISLNRKAGDDSNDIANPIIGQIFKIRIIDENYANNGRVYDKVLADADLQVHIIIDGNIWKGYISLSSFIKKIDPYDTKEIELICVDGFTRLKKEPADSTELYTYRRVQEYLDRLNFGTATLWVTDIEEIISSNSGILQTYMLTSGDSAYDAIFNLLKLLNCQIVQQLAVFVIFQRDIDIRPSATEYRYILPSTYSVVSFPISGVSNDVFYADSDFRDGSEEDIIPGAGTVDISMRYAERVISDDDPVDEGVLIMPYATLSTSTSPFRWWSINGGSPSYNSGSGFAELTSSSDDISTSWFGVLNLEKYSESGLDVDLELRSQATSGNTGNTYSVDALEIRLFVEDGSTYWLKEDGTWSSTQYYWQLSYTDIGGGTIVDSIPLSGNFAFPVDSGNAYMTIRVAYFAGDFAEFDEISLSTVTLEPAAKSTFSNIAKSIARNTQGELAISESVSGVINYTINPSGIYGVSRNTAISYKDKFYKLPDICAYKKASQQSKPLKVLKVTLDSIDYENLLFVSRFVHKAVSYRLQSIEENVFENTAKAKFVEFDVDTSGITMQRGIYS